MASIHRFVGEKAEVTCAAPGAARGQHRLPLQRPGAGRWKGREAWGGERRGWVLALPLPAVMLARPQSFHLSQGLFQSRRGQPERGVWLQDLLLVWSRAGLLCAVLPIQDGAGCSQSTAAGTCFSE